jgi:tetratricopeptide (TPR) repeat protein
MTLICGKDKSLFLLNPLGRTKALMNNPEQSKQDRVIRVFISSTFRDMMRERDLLVKEVFPALRRICTKRFVTFTEVDLRWGITEEQAAEGKVLPLCLAEIERSRPYFLGLLGERYGWIPDAIPAEVIEKEPWLKEHLHDRKSVTELEILHGVLNNPEMKGHSFFYFRDPAYVGNSSLTEEERREMVERDIPAEVKNLGPEEAARRTEERKGKLAALKQQIRDSKLPLVEPYENPEALAKIIEKQFGDLIDRLYPETDVPDALDRERLAHEAHARNKLFACIDRSTHLAALTVFAETPEHDGRGLVITGESGSGKTALLAAWTRDWATSHTDDFLFQHYFGATPDSSSPDGFLRRLLGELKKRFGITEEIPSQPDKLREALPLWLAQTINKGRIILIIDGLNQVQGDDPDKRLNFLPRYFPPHVVVLASSLPGPALDALRERRWTEHELTLADEGEVAAMIGAYLGIHARTLEPSLRKQLVTAPGSKNPLFLRTVLEELRQFGSFEKLADQVRHYLEADNPKELFLRVIRRWQVDFDTGIDLVRRGLTHLWAAREGLSEPEWLDLLGDQGTPLPRAYWTPLFLALEPHLSQRSGLFNFGHDFLRSSVEALFVPDQYSEEKYRLQLADYFEKQPITYRSCDELPWLLCKANQRDRLRLCILDIERFYEIQRRDQSELLGYWVWLGEEQQLGQAYLNAFEQYICLHRHNVTMEHLAKNTLCLGVFLRLAFSPSQSEKLLRRSIELWEQCPGHGVEIAHALHTLAGLLSSVGRIDEAGEAYRRALSLREILCGVNSPFVASSLDVLAGELARNGNTEEAESLQRRAIQICEQSHDGRTLPRYLNNLAGLLKGNIMRLPEAETVARKAVATAKDVLGESSPDYGTCLSTLATILVEMHRAEAGINAMFGIGGLTALSEMRLNEAENLYRQALNLDERFYGPHHKEVGIDLMSLGALFQELGRGFDALTCIKRSLDILERVLPVDHPLLEELRSILA